MKGIVKLITLTLICFSASITWGQETTVVEGYAYENGNRGYLNVVEVTAINPATNVQVAQVYSDGDGFFTFEAPAGQKLEVIAIKDMFQSNTIELTPEAGKKNFLQFELKREPGYIFEITMAEKRDDDETPVDAISGTKVEVYNNTTEEEVLALIDYQDPEFRVNLEKGNHYTILIRKKGYLAKRMEAFVNVKGCILCFEGIGSVRPGVSETMTEGNENGLLLANVALEKVFTGKKMEIENIYYDLAKWDIKPQAEKQLNTVIQLMSDNPRLTLELGSHTDSRGKDDYNMELSQKRAKAAVDYLKNSGNVKEGSITYRGYGETQITNKCTNGVKCSEAKHAVNRRTELKITGMFAESREKSLYQMKTEEKLEREILSGGSESDQIEVLPGETIDDALARIKLEKEEKAKLLGNGGSLKIEEENITEKTESVSEMKEAVEEKIENVSDIEIESEVEIEEEIIENQPVEKIKDYAREKEVVEEEIEEVVDEKIEELVEEEMDLSPTTGLGGLRVDVPQLPEDATGSFISISNGKERVPLTHKMYKSFPDLNWYPASDGKIYYVVNRAYPTKEKAQAYIDNYIKSDYPDAEVLRFVKGVRKK